MGAGGPARYHPTEESRIRAHVRTHTTNVDFWTNSIGTAVANVTPDGGGTGVATVLEGSQSGVIAPGTARHGVKRPFIEDVPIENLSPWVVSARLAQLTAGSTEFWLSSTAGAGGNNTIAGIVFEPDGDIVVIGGSTVDAGFNYVLGDTYHLWMEFDLVADSFTGYAENLTSGGGVSNLGSSSILGSDTAGNIEASGGLFVIGDQSSTTVFDYLQVGTGFTIPEPTTLALLALTGMIMWRRFRRASCRPDAGRQAAGDWKRSVQ